HPRGWVWLIPLAGDRASVGFVTTLERFRADGPPADLSRYHADALRELPEHEALFGAATRIDYRGDGQLVRSVQEYSYQCARVEGPGWALCGDAAGFVDAILSIGCFVAQAHAQFLACALATALDAPERERFALECYETVVRENLAAFRAVAHMFYAFNDTATEFWAACRDELRKGTLIPDARDKEASLAFFSGFSARNALYDTALGSLGGTFLTDVGGQLFKREALFKEDPMGERAAWAKRLARSDRALRLARGVELRPFALPRVEDGRLAPLTRVELSVDGHRRHLYVPDALAPAVRAFDGTRSIAAIARELAAGDAHAEAAYRTEAMKLAYRLLCMGALEDQGARGAA
ncbi:MAG: NAD(P)/FAD-dependent oxidoreductase, partial [Sandaracinaceae bacterium]